LDVIYKLSEVSRDGTRFLPAMKLSTAKKTLPGRKQVFRLKDKKGVFTKDILGLERENVSGEKLLHPAVENGRCVYDRVPLERIRARCAEQLACLPPEYKTIARKPFKAYPVRLSPGLAALTATISRRFSRGH
jgi:nicotinate phosphoribosyltransferase